MSWPCARVTARENLVWSLASVAVAASLLVPAPRAGEAPADVVLSGHAVAGVGLGQPEGSTLHRLEKLLGRPTRRLAPTPVLENCGVDATTSWRSLIVYFFDERLVGAALGPGGVPRGETAQGLRPGDTLARARAIYGRRLSTSTVQDGVWRVRTNSGRIDGFLLVHGPRPNNRSQIATIDIGVVGCPALSP